MLLQGLLKAHAIRSEVTRHGLFVKLLYPKQAHRNAVHAQTLVLSDLVPCNTQLRSRYSAPPSYLPPKVPANNGDDCSVSAQGNLIAEPSSDLLFVNDPWGKMEAHGRSRALVNESSVDCWASWSKLSRGLAAQRDPSADAPEFNSGSGNNSMVDLEDVCPTDHLHGVSGLVHGELVAGTPGCSDQQHVKAVNLQGDWRTLPRDSWCKIYNACGTSMPLDAGHSDSVQSDEHDFEQADEHDRDRGDRPPTLQDFEVLFEHMREEIRNQLAEAGFACSHTK